MENRNYYLILIACTFAGCLTIASVLAAKIITVFGLTVPAGVLAYSITFLCTDLTSEVWGKKAAQKIVTGGFLTLFTVFLLVQISLIWPPAIFYQENESFLSVLGCTSRIIIASFSAYLVSQYHDIWIFHFLKRLTGGRHLWIRNNLSTIISQFIDSFIFITVAFYGVMPIWPMIFSQWAVKTGIAVMDTPFVYLLAHFFNRRVFSASQP